MISRMFFPAIVILFVVSDSFSQMESKDSIYEGRVCVIILHNGFESDGIITEVKPDTIWFENIYTQYRIPVKDIRRILSTNEAKQVELYEDQPQQDALVDTTDECDVYLETGLVMRDVRLTAYDDSNITVLKGDVSRSFSVIPMRKIEFRKNNFFKGVMIGQGIGFAAGVLFMLLYSDHGNKPDFGQVLGISLIVSAPSALIGGIIGGVSSKDQVYLLPKGYSKLKSKRIKYIIESNSSQ